MTEQQQILRQFVLDNLHRLYIVSSSPGDFEHPEFDLYARDYLGFAEKELEILEDRNLLNCISHLKRAIDCQLDAFLYVFGLRNLFQKRNLKFDKKLEFFSAAGVFSSRTLSRINHIRNRMEHSYENPTITDLEAYFDLSVAFVSVLEKTIIYAMEGERHFVVSNEEYRGNREKIDGFFDITYDFNEPSITVFWHVGEEKRTLKTTISNMEEFAYFFRIFILLCQVHAFASAKYIFSQI